MNIFTWPPLIAACLNFSLAILALLRSPRQPVHRAFAAWNLSMGVWNSTIFMYYVVPDGATALRLGLWPRDAVMIIHALFFHFILCFIQNRKALNRVLLGIAYASGAFFIVANHIDGWLISGVKHFYYGFYPEIGPVGKLFPLLFNLYVWYAMYLLARTARESTGFRRNQSRLLLLGTLLVFGGALTNFLVVLGVHIYPIGNVINIIYSLLIAYAVVTYGLMDIRIVFRRSLIYAGLAAGLSGAYVLIVALIRQVLMHNDSLSVSYAYHMAAVPVTFALAPRMKSWIEPVVKDLPFLRTHDEKSVLERFNQSLFGLLELPILSDFIVTQLQDIFDTKSIVLYAAETPSSLLSRVAWTGNVHFDTVLPGVHPAAIYFRSHPSILLRDHLLWQADQTVPDSISLNLLDFLKATPLAVLIPIIFQNQLIGMIGLGEKISGEMFNSEDMHLLESLRPSVAVALSHVRALSQVDEKQSQIDRQKEMAIVGTMATEIAHELIKPLTHIMNAGSRLEADLRGAQRDSLRTIEKEAQRAAEILDGFSMLSPERQLHRIAIPLEHLVEESIGLLGVESDTRIRVDRDYDAFAPMKVNPGQMVQVFTNLIQNAWQSMPEGGVLTVCIRKAETGEAPESVEIVFTDTGLGIPSEIHSKVFEPFFSTKQTQGGRGMGLTISRAMVERHDGSLRLESPVSDGKGTRVIVRLPII